MVFLSEAAVEQALLDQLRGLGLRHCPDDTIGLDGSAPERDSHDVVIPQKRLEAAVLRLNPQFPPEARVGCHPQAHPIRLFPLLEENRRIHALLTEGADVEYYGDDGVLTAGKVQLLTSMRLNATTGWRCSSLWLSMARSSADRT